MLRLPRPPRPQREHTHRAMPGPGNRSLASPRLLRARSERPRRRAAQQCHELAPPIKKMSKLLRRGPAPGVQTDHTILEGRMLKVRQAQSSLRARASLAIAATAALLGAAQAQQSPPPSKLPLLKADPPAKRIITQ